MFVSLALAALLLEWIAGYPKRLFAVIGHPVTWIGALIAALDHRLNRDDASFAERRAWGVAALAMLLGVTFAVAALVEHLIGWISDPPGFALLALTASTLLAQRSLADHVTAVADALDRGGLDAGRVAVSHIVGRDPASLDEAGVSRAAIESLAESFCDGVVAPLFWLVIAGLPGAALYKAINTADSMIGHISPRHHAFGWAAARLDDLVNLPASRLAALWLICASTVLSGTSAGRAASTVMRDASRHKSPNAGWPEAAMAGSLGLKLAGPRTYDGEVTADHWMGDGRAEATSADIRRALVLYRAACWVQIAVLLVIGGLITGFN